MNPQHSPLAPVEILLVEDNEDDIELTQLAFEQSKMLNNLHVARDGIEGLEFLRREGQFAGAARPDLILLDLNMPRMDGREMLAEMKEDDELKRIPVVVLTTSDAQDDILRAYDMHANSYLTKPVDFSEFVKVATRIADYWFALVRLPRNGHVHS